MKNNVGIVVGKFDPLHVGHINMIQEASGIFDKTIVIISHSDTQSANLFKDSKLKRHLTGKDKLAIVQKTFQNQKDMIIPILVDETNVPTYPNGWDAWSQLVMREIINHRRVKNEIYDIHKHNRYWRGFVELNNVKFVVNEENDVENYKRYFWCDTELLDVERTEFPVSATMIRNNPHLYWDYVSRASREYLTPRIAICGGESSGKTIMTDKLANIYATTSVWEEGRLITDAELGGDESALQFKHYLDIANRHYQSLKFAMTHANKVLFSDTDFIATQAFSITYEGKPHPMVQQYIDDVRFDLVILLDNSTTWVDDGMRMLGEDSERFKFQQLLKELYDENGIKYVEIRAEDYDDRYNLCKLVVDLYLNFDLTVEELQEFVDKEQYTIDEIKLAISLLEE